MDTKKAWVWMIAAVLLILPGTDSASAETGRRALQALEGVYVSVERLDPDAVKDGLTQDMLRADAESVLRKAGIRVYAKDEWLRISGNPHLYINANILKLKETGEYIYAITIALRESVYLLRNPVEIWGASTWTKGGVVGITGRLEKIRSSVRGEVQAFVEAVRSQRTR